MSSQIEIIKILIKLNFILSNITEIDLRLSKHSANEYVTSRAKIH